MAKKNIKTASKLKNAKKYFDNRQFDAAHDLYVKVTEIDPRDAEAWFMAGVICGIQGRNNEALIFLKRATQLRPEHLLSQYNLGISYRDTGQHEKAIDCFKACIRLNPKYTQAYNSLAHVLMGLKHFNEASEIFRKLMVLEPDNAENHNDFGAVLQAMGQLDEAIEQYQLAVKLQPALTGAWNGLGSTFTASGRFDQAIEAYRNALQLDPHHMRAHSNLLLTLNYIGYISTAEIAEEHKVWGRQHGNVQLVKLGEIDKNLNRRLRIGYVSPDFREHSVSYFIEPVLGAHDKTKFEIFCYSSVPHNDEVTVKLQNLIKNWRDISKQATSQIIERIRQDKIDILVDLSGHTAGNHLDLFVYKPAPVQVTWIGYPNTTGLSVMDYRITDFITDPEAYDSLYVEKLVRLPGCFLSYLPPENAPDIVALPWLTNGFLTLGSFNNLAKISSGVISFWGEILRALPDARLLLKNPSLTDEKTRQRYYQYLKDAGAKPQQLELIGHTSSRFEHLRLYNRIDLALDTFPYNGTTTTCEAMWMGVPVLALLGNRHSSRVSASLLKATGLGEFVCADEADMLNKIKDFAADASALSELRQSMRKQLLASPLTNAATFTENLEKAYTAMWQQSMGTG